jgi:hypothetical protein
MESSIFWDIKSCSSLEVNRRCGGTCRLQLQDGSISQAGNQRESRRQAEHPFVEISEGNERQQVSSFWLALSTEEEEDSFKSSLDAHQSTRRHIRDDGLRSHLSQQDFLPIMFSVLAASLYLVRGRCLEMAAVMHSWRHGAHVARQ